MQTKRQIMQTIVELWVKESNIESDAKLWDLYQQDRITGGCYYVYNTYDAYEYKESHLLFDRAYRSRTSMEDIKMWDFTHTLKMLEKHYEKLRAFVEEQESLPFEQTQKQLLIKEGELKQIAD